MNNQEKIAFLQKQKPKFRLYRWVYWSITIFVSLPFLPCLIAYFSIDEGSTKNALLIIVGSIIGFNLFFPFFNYFAIVLPIFGFKNIYIMKDICQSVLPSEARSPQGFFRVFDRSYFLLWILFPVYIFFQGILNWSWKIGWSLGKKQMLFVDGIDLVIERIESKNLKDDILQVQLDAIFGKDKPKS